jgi:murein DD-endopeptidase MepM/ murein hydrolase activator NlpD
MSNLMPRTLLMALLVTLVFNGCSVYEKYGYGKVVRSKLDPDQVTALELPANAPSISQRYRPTVAVTQGEHRGFDLLVPRRTPVLAASDGVVSRVALSFLFGNQVMLNHQRSAAGYRIQTRYFHLSETLVSAGEAVRRGQLIGYSGMTGLAAGYPHLHFEVHQLDDSAAAVAIRDLDPQRYWFDGVGKVSCYDSSRDFSATAASLTYPVPCRDLEWRQ